MTAVKYPRIAVFDSGVGGLTVHDALSERLPWCDLIYCCDNKNFPYGPKPEERVLEIVMDVTSQLAKREPLDCLVIACNTASTLCLPRLREILPLSVVGVVPAIKPAALLSKTGVIGLLATPGTVARPYTKELINQFAGNKKVISVGSARLVDMAEEKLRGQTLDSKEVAEILAPLFDEREGRVDQVVLGCTHFPLLREEFRAAASWQVNWIDSAAAIASRVWTLMQQQKAPSKVKVGQRSFYFTQQSGSAESLVPQLRERGFQNIEILG